MLDGILIALALVAATWAVLVLASNDRGDISYWPIAAPAFLLALGLVAVVYVRNRG